MARAAAEGRLGYDDFLTEIRREQLALWLPAEPGRVLDLSAGCPALLEVMTDGGHDVVHVTADPTPPVPRHPNLHLVVGGAQRLDWVRPASLDAVVAEGGALSSSLATEVTIDDIFGVLRPGGRLLLAVQSLTSGLARLAGQERWAELADVPAADVVLIPATDGSIWRCFWPEELHGMLAAAGFAVEWVRPRTVLAEDTVTMALAGDPFELRMLVQTELRLAAEREGQSLGAQLVASAVRP